MTPIAEILKQAREEKQLTQKDVAMAANIPVSQYERYETGEYNLLSASMTIAHKICRTLNLDPSSLLEATPSALENYERKAVMYAAFPKGSKDISIEALMQLAASTVENTQCTLIDAVIDEDNNRSCTRREKWTQLMQRCENEDIDILIIPSITMLGYGILSTIQYLRYLKQQHDRFDVYFLYENIYTGADCFDEHISFYCMVDEYIRRQQQRKVEFRKIYKSAQQGK